MLILLLIGFYEACRNTNIDLENLKRTCIYKCQVWHQVNGHQC